MILIFVDQNLRFKVLGKFIWTNTRPKSRFGIRQFHLLSISLTHNTMRIIKRGCWSSWAIPVCINVGRWLKTTKLHILEEADPKMNIRTFEEKGKESLVFPDKKTIDSRTKFCGWTLSAWRLAGSGKRLGYLKISKFVQFTLVK